MNRKPVIPSRAPAAGKAEAEARNATAERERRGRGYNLKDIGERAANERIAAAERENNWREQRKARRK